MTDQLGVGFLLLTLFCHYFYLFYHKKDAVASEDVWSM